MGFCHVCHGVLLGTVFSVCQNIKNRDIKWEKQTTNIGLDLGFLNNRINVTMDWHNKISSDMLMELSLPSIMGTSETDLNLMHHGVTMVKSKIPVLSLTSRLFLFRQKTGLGILIST